LGTQTKFQTLPNVESDRFQGGEEEEERGERKRKEKQRAREKRHEEKEEEKARLERKESWVVSSGARNDARPREKK
jgi:hypothetical protein